MRFLFPITSVTLVLILCLASPLAAKGGKGGGKGKGGGSAASRGPASGQHARANHQLGGQQRAGKQHGGAADRQDLADSHKKPAKDKHQKHGQRDEHADDRGEREREHEREHEREREREREHEREHEHERDADGGGKTTPHNKKEKQLANFQRQRDQQLAQADHLRQIAERNGNENLLANADRMEAQALDQYARKAARLEKFGVTDPALPPGGVNNPVGPGVDPVLPAAQPAAARPPLGRSSWWPFRW